MLNRGRLTSKTTFLVGSANILGSPDLRRQLDLWLYPPACVFSGVSGSDGKKHWILVVEMLKCCAAGPRAWVGIVEGLEKWERLEAVGISSKG